MWKPGARAPAACPPRATIDFAPGSRRAWGARPGLPSSGSAPRSPEILVLVVLTMLLLVPADSAVINRPDRTDREIAAPQLSVHEGPRNLCLPGYYVSSTSGNCTLCPYGLGYTNYSNALPSCLLCTVCKPDEEEMSPCIRTRDTQCRCKRGTFRGKDSPEICQKCSTGCPDEMVPDSPCTPWSDLRCVPREAGFGNLGMWLWIGSAVVILVLLVFPVLLWRHILRGEGCAVVSRFLNGLLPWRQCSSKGLGADENTYNETLSNRKLQPRLDRKLEGGSQEQAGMTGAKGQTPVEARPLLENPKPEGSQIKRMLLVPVNGTDPSQTLRSFFSYFIKEVPFLSWNPVMREMGLTDNEIHVATARAVSPEEVPYNLLVRWHQKTGHSASVNTLLEALETVGKRKTRETIQAHLVDSGHYIYQEYEADSCC